MPRKGRAGARAEEACATTAVSRDVLGLGRGGRRVEGLNQPRVKSEETDRDQKEKEAEGEGFLDGMNLQQAQGSTCYAWSNLQLGFYDQGPYVEQRSSKCK